MSNILERALAACNGNASELARRSGLPVERIFEMKKGRAKIGPYYASKLAQVAGERDSDKAIYEALAETARSKQEKEHWLGKLTGLIKTAAALAVIVLGGQIFQTEDHASGVSA